MSQWKLVLSGALFSLAWWFFIDACILANKEPFPHNRPTFLHWLPGFMSTIAFFIINITDSKMFAGSAGGSLFDTERNQTAAVTLVIGWILNFGATIISLTLVGTEFLSPNDSTYGWNLANGLVMQPSLLGLSAALLWSHDTSDTTSFRF